MKNYRIALIPGDGIGTEVLTAGWNMVTAAAEAFSFDLDPEWRPWS